MKVLLSCVLLLIAGAFVVNRVLAPLNGRYDAAECRAAYASARSHHDSVEVDLHPALTTAGGRMKHWCGEVRARRFESVVDLSVIVPPSPVP